MRDHNNKRKNKVAQLNFLFLLGRRLKTDKLLVKIGQFSIIN